MVRAFWCEMLGGQEALRRSLSLSLRRSLRRSLASRPPHTPAAWLVLRAYWRQASIAGHSAQISLAREAGGGSSEAGKKMSLETPLQAASFRQSQQGPSCTSPCRRAHLRYHQANPLASSGRTRLRPGHRKSEGQSPDLSSSHPLRHRQLRLRLATIPGAHRLATVKMVRSFIHALTGGAPAY